MSDHFTVRVAVNRVRNLPGTTEYISGRSTPVPGKREDTEVINLVIRMDGVTDFALDRAIVKAIKHLENERPDVCPEVTVSADDKAIARLSA